MELTIDKTIHKDIWDKLFKFYNEKSIPNILLHGGSGSGKKTLLYRFINLIYNNDSNLIKQYVMEIRCGDGIGIGFIRDDLKLFARGNIGKIMDFKSIILYNADKLTCDAQSALRRCIEEYSKTTRFFIITHNKHRLLKPILSRFAPIFVPLPIKNGNATNLLYQKDKNNNLNEIKISSIINKNKNSPFCVTKIVNELYNLAIHSFDILNFIENNDQMETQKKYKLLFYLDEFRKDIYNEKLFMFISIFYYLEINSIDIDFHFFL